VKKRGDEMSERQAERIIEQFENGSRNGAEWAHDVCLHRGTEKYEQSLSILNEAFKIKSINRQIVPLPFDASTALHSKRARR
jgi:hypothetical protein